MLRAEQRAATPQKPAGERISVADRIRSIMPSSTPTGLRFLRESLGLKVPTLSFAKKAEGNNDQTASTEEKKEKTTADIAEKAIDSLAEKTGKNKNTNIIEGKESIGLERTWPFEEAPSEEKTDRRKRKS